MISNLPSSLIENILTHLPIREAVGTSILSRKWRYNWTNLPKLVFDDSLLPQHPNRTQLPSTPKELFLTIYKILAMQNSPVLDFCLNINNLIPSGDVDLLVSYLSRNNVEKLSLYFFLDKYKLPNSLFSCLRLTHLDLDYCILEPPLTFQGFSNLVSLELVDVSFDAGTFASFISSCPLLERLTLLRCTSFCFQVTTPKLKSLYLGNIVSVHLKDVPILAIVSIQPKSEVITSGLIMFFESLPALEYLEMNYHLFKSLVAGGSIPKKLPTTLVQLRNLKLIDMSLAILDEVLFVLCLIRSCPNLQRFTIQFSPRDSDLGVENLFSEDCLDLSLNQLREVVFHRASGTPPELEFIKPLLANSPILESVLVDLT